MDADFMDPADIEEDLADDNDSIYSSSSSLVSKQTSPNQSELVPDGGYYHFEVQPHHFVKGRLGRKNFKCDICSGVYRHAFSLKRHYIRTHINHRYVPKADLINCKVSEDSLVVAGDKEGSPRQKDTQVNDNELTGESEKQLEEQSNDKSPPQAVDLTQSPNSDSNKNESKSTAKSSKTETETKPQKESAKSNESKNESQGNSEIPQVPSSSSSSSSSASGPSISSDKNQTTNVAETETETKSSKSETKPSSTSLGVSFPSSSGKKLKSSKLGRLENICLKLKSKHHVTDEPVGISDLFAGSTKTENKTETETKDKTETQTKITEKPNKKVKENEKGDGKISKASTISSASDESKAPSETETKTTNQTETSSDKQGSGSILAGILLSKKEDIASKTKPSKGKTESSESKTDTSSDKTSDDTASTSQYVGSSTSPNKSSLKDSPKPGSSTDGKESSSESPDPKKRPGLFRCNLCEKLFDTVPQLKVGIQHFIISLFKIYSSYSLSQCKITVKPNLLFKTIFV